MEGIIKDRLKTKTNTVRKEMWKLLELIFTTEKNKTNQILEIFFR